MTRSPPTAAEISEMDRRTTDIGLFNFADSYLRCAATLLQQKIEGLLFSDPIEYQINHATELFLKSYLRSKGISTYELGRKYGHNLTKLANKAKRFGLSITDADKAKLDFLQRNGLVIESRYIITGAKSIIPVDELFGVSQRIRREVEISLRADGKPIRADEFYSGVVIDTSHTRLGI